MPDFNKGDFTQQGVNGHVNATVRLNEKRLVNIDLTSNEEAEGCTITGVVVDLLNDTAYEIGSGGGSGLPTLALKIINSTGEEIRNASADAFRLTDNAITILPDLLADETAEINAVYFYVEIMDDVFYVVTPLYEVMDQTPLTYTYSDLVNCEAQLGSQLNITDPFQNSSATLTITK